MILGIIMLPILYFSAPIALLSSSNESCNALFEEVMWSPYILSHATIND